jgi:hypothetical protein
MTFNNIIVEDENTRYVGKKLIQGSVEVFKLISTNCLDSVALKLIGILVDFYRNCTTDRSELDSDLIASP